MRSRQIGEAIATKLTAREREILESAPHILDRLGTGSQHDQVGCCDTTASDGDRRSQTVAESSTGTIINSSSARTDFIQTGPQRTLTCAAAATIGDESRHLPGHGLHLRDGTLLGRFIIHRQDGEFRISQPTNTSATVSMRDLEPSRSGRDAVEHAETGVHRFISDIDQLLIFR